MNGRDGAMVVVALGLAAASAVTLRAEVLPFVSGGPPLAHVEAAAGAPLDFGLSTYSRNLALDQCMKVMTGAEFPRLAPDGKDKILATCGKTAAMILAASPTNSYAAAILGLSDAFAGVKDAALPSLERSQRLSPSLAWLASLRIRPWWENILSLSEGGGPLTADVRMLGGTEAGRGWLANWYVVRPEAREFLLEQIQALPPEDQRAFLDAVRKATSASSATGGQG